MVGDRQYGTELTLCSCCVCLQELANRLVAGEEAIYEGLPDVAAAVAITADTSTLGRAAVSPAVQLLQVEPLQALKQLTSTLAAAAGM